MLFGQRMLFIGRYLSELICPAIRRLSSHSSNVFTKFTKFIKKSSSKFTKFSLSKETFSNFKLVNQRFIYFWFLHFQFSCSLLYTVYKLCYTRLDRVRSDLAIKAGPGYGRLQAALKRLRCAPSVKVLVFRFEIQQTFPNPQMSSKIPIFNSELQKLIPPDQTDWSRFLSSNQTVN